MKKVSELFYAFVIKALSHPKTTALGLAGVIGGVQIFRHGNHEGGLVAILTGLGLVFASDGE